MLLFIQYNSSPLYVVFQERKVNEALHTTDLSLQRQCFFPHLSSDTGFDGLGERIIASVIP